MTYTTQNIASPITLSLHITEVVIQDYIFDLSCIENIVAPEGIEIWENKKKGILQLEIIDSEIVPQVSTLDFYCSAQEIVSVVLIKSKKITFPIRYYPHGYVQSVQIAGDFNSWNPQGYDFSFKNGCWQYDLDVEPGNYSYQLIVDGNWINDPSNHEYVENGYGGSNSMLRVPFSNTNNTIHIFCEKFMPPNAVIHIQGSIDNYLVLWQNQVINEIYTFQHLQKLLVTIPTDAKDFHRSYLRVYVFDKETVSNDLLIPLQYDSILNSPINLTRNDKESQVVYFSLIDRFHNGTPGKDTSIKDNEIHPKLNFHGGNLIGIQKKIEDGYFTNLGINTIWISPVVKNPENVVIKNGEKFVGYHGYWPIDSEAIDERFGSEKDFKELVHIAHAKGINIILDYVANHVHQENPIIKNNPNWSTPLYLPDGSKNIGRWEDQRFTTWFEDFLPTLNYDIQEVTDTMTDIAVEWIKKYNLDGFRHDATKHISSKFWRTLTYKLKKEIILPENKRLYQIGETFGGREMLKTYTNSGIHNGQFSFNLYYEARSSFLYEEVHFEKLCTSLQQDLFSFGYNHEMGNISGNHDMPRFISYAGEDLWMNQNAEHEGWNRHISVKNPIGYKKLLMLHAFNCTIPGIPVIYYGDEIGMPGGGDPDNRRPMKFFGLSTHEQHTLHATRELIRIRTRFLPFIYGDFSFIQIEKQILIYKRVYFDNVAYVVFNKSHSKKTVVIPNEHTLSDKTVYSLQKKQIQLKNAQIILDIDALSYDIIYSHPYEAVVTEVKSEHYIA